MRGQGDSLTDLVEICSLFLQPLTILVPLKPCWIRLSHSNRFVQDHLQTELGNISPHSAAFSSPCVLHCVMQMNTCPYLCTLRKFSKSFRVCFSRLSSPSSQDIWISSSILVIDNTVLLVKPALQRPLWAVRSRVCGSVIISLSGMQIQLQRRGEELSHFQRATQRNAEGAGLFLKAWCCTNGSSRKAGWVRREQARQREFLKAFYSSV